MGLFDHFPYTNVHELNLDWVLSMMKALEAEWEAFTAGNSLTFADPMLHDVSKTYAKNTIVLDGNGNAYVSLQAVPVGVGLQNGDYWLMVFDYEAFIEKVNKNFTANYYRGSYRAASAMAIGDWLTVDDVLYKTTAAIAVDDVLEVGVNIEHFTLEDFIKAFMQSANQLIQQYKNDIDASELAYRQQLAQDIANTTASLQAQLDAAIAGATVDSEVINARVGINNYTYPNLHAAIDTQDTFNLRNSGELLTPDETKSGKYFSNVGLQPAFTDNASYNAYIYNISSDYEYNVLVEATGASNSCLIALTDNSYNTYLIIKTDNGTTDTDIITEHIRSGRYNRLVVSTKTTYIQMVIRLTPVYGDLIAEEQAASVVLDKYLRNDGSGLNNLSGLLYVSYDLDPEYEYYAYDLLSGGASVVPIALADSTYTYFKYLATSVGGGQNTYTASINIEGSEIDSIFTKVIMCFNYQNRSDDCHLYKRSKISGSWELVTPDNVNLSAYMQKQGSGLVSPSVANNNIQTYEYITDSIHTYRAIVAIHGGINIATICKSNTGLTEYAVLSTGTPSDDVIADMIITANQYAKITLSTILDGFGNAALYRLVPKTENISLRIQNEFVQKEHAATAGNTITDLTDLTGKTWNAVGDSLTATDHYRTSVATRLGVTEVNCGISGSTIAINNTYLTNQSMVERVLGLNGNTPYSAADIWTIFGGINDVNYDTPIGDITSTDKTTFYGALKAICEYIQLESNNPKLLLITPPKTFYDQTKPEQMRKVVVAIKELAQLYSVPVIDLYNECGISAVNLRNLTSDRLHWNSLGDVMAYPIIASKIREYC